jgi:hypothetical protein
MNPNDPRYQAFLRRQAEEKGNSQRIIDVEASGDHGQERRDARDAVKDSRLTHAQWADNYPAFTNQELKNVRPTTSWGVTSNLFQVPFSDEGQFKKWTPLDDANCTKKEINPSDCAHNTLAALRVRTLDKSYGTAREANLEKQGLGADVVGGFLQHRTGAHLEYQQPVNLKDGVKKIKSELRPGYATAICPQRAQNGHISIAYNAGKGVRVFDPQVPDDTNVYGENETMKIDDYFNRPKIDGNVKWDKLGYYAYSGVQPGLFGNSKTIPAFQAPEHRINMKPGKKQEHRHRSSVRHYGDGAQEGGKKRRRIRSTRKKRN